MGRTQCEEKTQFRPAASVLPEPAGLRPALGLRGWLSTAFLEGTEIGFFKTMKGQPTHLSICPFFFPKPCPRGLSESHLPSELK